MKSHAYVGAYERGNGTQEAGDCKAENNRDGDEDVFVLSHAVKMPLSRPISNRPGEYTMDLRTTHI